MIAIKAETVADPQPIVTCDSCSGAGVLEETPATCSCLHHRGAVAVTESLSKGLIDGRTAARMLMAIIAKDIFCPSCRASHACTLCGGKGTL